MDSYVIAEIVWGLGWFGLLYVTLTIFQSYRDLETGYTLSLKSNWRDPGSNPGPLTPQAKSLTTLPPPLEHRLKYMTATKDGHLAYWMSSPGAICIVQRVPIFNQTKMSYPLHFFGDYIIKDHLGQRYFGTPFVRHNSGSIVQRST